MARLSKCKGCNKELDISERKILSNKTYCIECYDSKIREKENYDNLISWICNYFNNDRPNGLILKQIKEYKDTFQYTYGGIAYCLWYITSIKGVKLDIKYGIALVKFEYENSKNYFLQQQSISESVKNIEPPVKVTKIIKVKANRKSNDKFLLNIDDLISEEE